MPPWPIWSPAWYGAPSALACALVAATTVPVSSSSDPDWACMAVELSWVVPSAARMAARAGQTALSAKCSPARRPG